MGHPSVSALSVATVHAKARICHSSKIIITIKKSTGHHGAAPYSSSTSPTGTGGDGKVGTESGKEGEDDAWKTLQLTLTIFIYCLLAGSGADGQARWDVDVLG